jgi:hypothetical protein
LICRLVTIGTFEIKFREFGTTSISFVCH